jgi:hypothetical protein
MAIPILFLLQALDLSNALGNLCILKPLKGIPDVM